MIPFKYNIDAEQRFWSKVIFPEDLSKCWLWNGTPSKDGYGQFKYHCIPKRPNRFVYESCIDIIPDGLIIMHTCDNPRCVNPAHLIPGTHKDNAQDRNRKGRDNHAFGEKLSFPGERNPNCRLTKVQVEQIRLSYAKGNISQQKLADEYGVNQAHISYIVHRKGWK